MTYLPVLVAGVSAFLFGWLWHGPLFGKQWMKLSGFSKPDVITPEIKKRMLTSMAFGLVAITVSAGVLSCLMNQIGKSDLMSTLSIAFWIWLGFVVTTLANGPLWEDRSVKLFFFNVVYHLASVSLIAVILSLMA